jgi:hypothetical protein
VDDQTGEPIDGFALEWGAAYPQKPDEIVWGFGFTIERRGDGRFQTQRNWETERKVWLRVVAGGYLPEPVTPKPVVWPARLTNLVVRLKRGGELHGIVLDHTGKPVAGANVFLTGVAPLSLTDGKDGHFKGSTAATDAEGRFALRGAGTPGERVVVSADTLQFWFAPEAEPGKELKITLPEPATLIVCYDIPDDVPKTQLRLQLKTWELSHVKEVTCIQEPTVMNQSRIVLTNLAPGTYDLARPKMLRVGTEAHGLFCDRLTVVLQAGQTQRVDFVRATGHPIRGEVVGLKDANAPVAFIYVRSAEATGDPRRIEERMLPLFDAVTCDEAGRFSTARLEPGTYTIVVEAFIPEPHSHTIDTGIRLPDYIGTAKVTVSAVTSPAPVKIELSPRPRTK